MAGGGGGAGWLLWLGLVALVVFLTSSLRLDNNTHKDLLHQIEENDQKLLTLRASYGIWKDFHLFS